ncbi:60S ribosomal protein L36-like [Apodemus sylvaticus]|uniref:60S ribosomal protein L36-like n=1 Tax=Apodemus sylvaticus TaxID=10129 RepID=UPI002241F519|nr:60S ribosomal protein L36-like [Apodemus sylvaticus]XP_052023950.1 60S ribosomal protein L36-like [Apodemus sylvaticus]
MALRYPMAVASTKPQGEEHQGTKTQPASGRLTKRTKFVRDAIQEVQGFAPQEQSALESLSVHRHARTLVHQEESGRAHPGHEKAGGAGNVLAAMRKAVAKED